MFRLLRLLGCLGFLAILGVAYATFHFHVVRGSGRVVGQDRSVSGFDAVTLDGAGRLQVRQGSREGLTIHAEDNILPSITARVDGHTLILGYQLGWLSHAPIPTRPIEYTVTVRHLSALTLNGDASVTSSRLTTDALAVALHGLDSADLEVRTKRLQLSVAGSGTAHVTGRAADQLVQLAGQGTYDAQRLASDNCTISIAGAGSATVNARRKLIVQIAGSGEVRYAGHPEVTQQITGLGKIDRL